MYNRLSFARPRKGDPLARSRRDQSPAKGRARRGKQREGPMTGTILRKGGPFGGGIHRSLLANSYRVVWLLEDNATHIRYPFMVVTWSIFMSLARPPWLGGGWGTAAYFEEGDDVEIREYTRQRLLFTKYSPMLEPLSGGDVKYIDKGLTVMIDPIFVAHGEDVIRLSQKEVDQDSPG